MTEPPWMRIADGEMGQAEVPGDGVHNRRILSYATDIGASWVTTDETPWCAAFVGACLQRAGLTHTASMRARSYLAWGVPADPVRGAIVVLRRGADERSGHVGFLHERRGGKVYLLGGNQGNAVSIAAFMEVDVLGYRWPSDFPAGGVEIEAEVEVLAAAAEPKPKPAPKPVPAPDPQTARPRVEVAARSRTVFGGLVALAGWVVLQLQSGLQFAIEAVAAAGELAPVKSLLVSLGGNLQTIGTAMAIGGVVYAIARRVADGKR